MNIFRRRRKVDDRDREEINRASRKVEDLTRRTRRIVQENNLARDIKKALGAR